MTPTEANDAFKRGEITINALRSAHGFPPAIAAATVNHRNPATTVRPLWPWERLRRPLVTVQGSPPRGQQSPHTFAGRIGENLSGSHAVVRNDDGSGARDVQRHPAESGAAWRLGQDVGSSRTPHARLLAPWRAWHRRLVRRHRAASYGGAA